MKQYMVNGRQDGLMLRITYRITGFGLEVERMWLELPRGDQAGIANQDSAFSGIHNQHKEVKKGWYCRNGEVADMFLDFSK